jgi:hypothetical protein
MIRLLAFVVIVILAAPLIMLAGVFVFGMLLGGYADANGGL